MLYSTGMKIQKTDFTDDKQRKEAVALLAEVLELIERHSLHEDTYIFPHVTTYDGALLAELEEDHAHGHKLDSKLLQLVDELQVPTNHTTLQSVGAELFHTFNRYIAFHLEHMEKEEEKVNPLLWKYYSDEEITRMKSPIVNSGDSGLLLKEIAWTLQSISSNEAIQWLIGLQSRVSLETMEGFKKVAKEVLPAGDLNAIETQLTA